MLFSQDEDDCKYQAYLAEIEASVLQLATLSNEVTLLKNCARFVTDTCVPRSELEVSRPCNLRLPGAYSKAECVCVCMCVLARCNCLQLPCVPSRK